MRSGHGTAACDVRIGPLGSGDGMDDRLAAAGGMLTMSIDRRTGDRGMVGYSMMLVGELTKEALGGGKRSLRSEAFRGGTIRIPSGIM